CSAVWRARGDCTSRGKRTAYCSFDVAAAGVASIGSRNGRELATELAFGLARACRILTCSKIECSADSSVMRCPLDASESARSSIARRIACACGGRKKTPSVEWWAQKHLTSSFRLDSGEAPMSCLSGPADQDNRDR